MLPVYDYDAAFAREVDESLARLFSTARLWLTQGVPLTEPLPTAEEEASAGEDVMPVDPVAELVAQLQDVSGVRLDQTAYVALIEQQFAPELEESLRSIAAETFRRGIVANKELLLEHRARGVTLRNLEDAVRGDPVQPVRLPGFIPPTSTPTWSVS